MVGVNWVVCSKEGLWRSLEHEGDYIESDTLYRVEFMHKGLAYIKEIIPDDRR